jgi:hypothetical protein
MSLDALRVGLEAEGLRKRRGSVCIYYDIYLDRFAGKIYES